MIVRSSCSKLLVNPLTLHFAEVDQEKTEEDQIAVGAQTKESDSSPK